MPHWHGERRRELMPVPNRDDECPLFAPSNYIQGDLFFKNYILLHFFLF
ncbi:hypothetical protein ASZ90_010556 [hydrocarbon metagenome]|uniref:Uncharacterized protein n=1 Tax=hydrocarbon metagenome TaxID=938273 RepID=A0A0W8FFU0_9ZZZZ